jgi:parvulin-like peptidyl-prolyl isomerase
LKRRVGILVVAGALIAVAAARLHAQEVIDRIVARIESDIILLSEVQALSRYQQLVDGKSESDAQILDRLIDQWIVRSEAETAQFPRPSDEDIAAGIDRVEKSFTSSGEYEARRRQAGLTDTDVKNMVAAQLYLSNYLDSRFRPSAQIDPKDVEDFYQKAVVPRAQARGQAPPSLDAARDYIHEALVQRSINEQADRWLNESRARVKVNKFVDQGTK